MQYPTANFEFKVDLRTSTAIAALNAGIMNSSDLLDITDKVYTFSPLSDEGYTYYYGENSPSSGSYYYGGSTY